MDSNDQQAFKMTSALTLAYQEDIIPYELVVESIALQNKELYQLEKQYVAMQNQMQGISDVIDNEQQLLANRNKQRILERKLLAEQALIANEKKYQEEFRHKRKQLEEEIDLLQEQISIQGGSKINIFMNLSQGLLNQMLEENHKNEEVLAPIKYWKDTYEHSKKEI